MGYRKGPRAELTFTVNYLRETCDSDPSLQNPVQRCLSENTVNAALRRLGYSSEEQTGHGFRSMASTLLNEQGFPPDVIELQLAHAERNKVRAAYNKAQRLPERRKMMQAWADYLDGLRTAAI
jgi:integrase